MDDHGVESVQIAHCLEFRHHELELLLILARVQASQVSTETTHCPPVLHEPHPGNNRKALTTQLFTACATSLHILICCGKIRSSVGRQACRTRTRRTEQHNEIKDKPWSIQRHECQSRGWLAAEPLQHRRRYSTEHFHPIYSSGGRWKI